MPRFATAPRLALLAALAASACATASNHVDQDVREGGAGDGASGAGGEHAGTGGGGGEAGAPLFDGGGDDAPGGDGAPIIYAHTDTKLFQLDPKTNQLTEVGDFDCVGGSSPDESMTDLAVDKSLKLWGISAHYVYALEIQGSTVHCASQVALSNASERFYGLTFAPAGVLDPNEEVLVAANNEGQLWSIDAQGNLTQRGTFGKVPANDGNGHTYANAGTPWQLSGDLVFLANGGSPVGFATVRDCSGTSASTCNAVNTLIEIDVPKLATATTQSVTKSVRGQIVSGCSDGLADYGNMYGIAAWNQAVYGFSRTGNLVKIDVNDATGCLVQAYATDKFAGAGVTTLAPISEPPPK